MMVEHSFLPRKKELSVTVDFSTKGNGAIMIKVLVAKKSLRHQDTKDTKRIFLKQILFVSWCLGGGFCIFEFFGLRSNDA
jgi:hypothetical protein